MRFLKTFLLMVLASAFLVACGGEGDSATGGGSSTNLNAVYDKLTRNMNYEQVKGLVGYAHNGGETSIHANDKSYTWTSGAGTISSCFLIVGFDNIGVITALYNGNCDGTFKGRTKIL